MSKRPRPESEKVENMASYFKKEHYEDVLLSDEELEKDVLFEEDNLSIYNY